MKLAEKEEEGIFFGEWEKISSDSAN